jgi:GNAT superfamily N-acetyltransferase
MENGIWRTREWLCQKYIVEGLSWEEIASIVSRTSTAVRFAAKKFGIKSRTVSEIRQNINKIPLKKIKAGYESGRSIADIAKDYNVVYSVMRNKLLLSGVNFRKREETKIITFGNRENSLPLEQWANKEFLEDKYTCLSINQISELVGWSYTYVHDLMCELGIKLRDFKSSIALKWNEPEYRQKHAEYLSSNPKVSSIQLLLYNTLDDLDIEYCREGPATLIGHYSFDCLVKSTPCDILIEVQGEYWHSLKNAKKNDSSKFTYINKYFPQYEIMYIWENEFSDLHKLINRLRNKLHRSVEITDFEFNELKVSEVSRHDCKSLLDAYHYLGGNRGGLAYGAWYRDELIAVVLYSNPIRQQTEKFIGLGNLKELSRLCIDPKFQKKNLGSWFVSRTLQSIQADAVIAYADTTRGHVGTVYKACNFDLHHEIPPDYWYIDDLGIVIHKKTLYNRARLNNVKEAIYAQKHGYKKVFGGKKLAFVKLVTNSG